MKKIGFEESFLRRGNNPVGKITKKTV